MKKIFLALLLVIHGLPVICMNLPVVTVRGLDNATIKLSYGVADSMPLFKNQLGVCHGTGGIQLFFPHDQKGLNFLQKYAIEKHVIEQNDYPLLATKLENSIRELSLSDLGYYTVIVDSVYQGNYFPYGFQQEWIRRINDGTILREDVSKAVTDPEVVEKIYNKCWQNNPIHIVPKETDPHVSEETDPQKNNLQMVVYDSHQTGAINPGEEPLPALKVDTFVDNSLRYYWNEASSLKEAMSLGVPLLLLLAGIYRMYKK